MGFCDHSKAIFLTSTIYSLAYMTFGMQVIISYEAYLFSLGFIIECVVNNYTSFYNLNNDEINNMWSNIVALAFLVPLWINFTINHSFGNEISSDIVIGYLTLAVGAWFVELVRDILIALSCSCISVNFSSKYYKPRKLILFWCVVVLLTLVGMFVLSGIAGALFYMTNPPNGVLRVDPYNRNVTMTRVHLENDNSASPLSTDGNINKHWTIYQYKYEDVRFKCHFQRVDNSEADILWTFSGKPLLRHHTSLVGKRKLKVFNYSFNTKITLTTNYLPKSSKYVTILEIILLEEPLFGMYECLIRRVNSDFKSIRTFHLHIAPSWDMKIKSQIGETMRLNSYEWNINNPEELIHFEHRVNDIMIGNLGPPGCNPLMTLYAAFLHCVIFKKAPCRTVPFTATEKFMKYVTTRAFFCTNPNMFGRYTIMIHRQLFNSFTGEMDDIVFEMPGRIVIEPSVNVFYREDIVYTVFQNEQIYLITDDEFVQHCIKICHVIRLFVETTLLGYLYIAIVFFVKTCWGTYIRLAVVPIMEYLLMNGGAQPTYKNPLVLCHEDDSQKILENLVKPLEDEGIKLYFSEREFSELGNMPMFKIRNIATSKCNKTILVLSRNLLCDRCASFNYLDCMVVSKIEYGETNSENALIVRLDSCKIPHEYRDTFRRVKIIDFDSSASDAQKKSFLKIVKSWARDPSTYEYLCDRVRKMIKRAD